MGVLRLAMHTKGTVSFDECRGFFGAKPTLLAGISPSCLSTADGSPSSAEMKPSGAGPSKMMSEVRLLPMGTGGSSVFNVRDKDARDLEEGDRPRLTLRRCARGVRGDVTVSGE